MTFPTNSVENNSFLVSSQHPLRCSSFSKTKQPPFSYSIFNLQSSQLSLVSVRLPFLTFCTKSSPRRGSVTKCTASMLDKMIVLLLHSISFYLQLDLHFTLQSCKTYLMILSHLPLLCRNADWNLDSSHQYS